jgi:hypothetical protein
MGGVQPVQAGDQNRCFQRLMVGAVVPSRCLMVLYEAPSANIRISLARNTYPAGKDRDWEMRSSSKCWSSESNTDSLVT